MAKQTRKVMCSITGDWAYCSEERFQALRKQFGSIAELNANYMSRQGKKLVDSKIPEGLEGDELATARATAIAEAKAECQNNPGKNKIFCTLTGERMYISPARMKHLMEVGNCTEDEVRANYKSRVAKRLEKKLAQSMYEKEFSDLETAEIETVHAEIRKMKDEGTLPAPAKKGKNNPTAKSAPKSHKKGGTVVIDETGESKKDRRNRLRRERRAAQKAEQAAQKAEQAAQKAEQAA